MKHQLDTWEVMPDEGSQGPSSSIHPGVGYESIHNVDSINTAFLGIDIYKYVIIDGYHPKYVYTLCSP